MTPAQGILKRAFDLAASATGLFLLSPLLVLTAIVVKASSKGPVLFAHTRVGRGAKVFVCRKFRTMYTGSEGGGSVTTARDSRVTPAGKVLRRLKLDELPQLFNVLVGEMSLVGPRPDVPGYADRLTGDDRRLLTLRPGITGPATLAFRDEESLLAAQADPQRYNDEVLWPRKVRMNLDYLDHWSFWRDIGYILCTVSPWAGASTRAQGG